MPVDASLITYTEVQALADELTTRHDMKITLLLSSYQLDGNLNILEGASRVFAAAAGFYLLAHPQEGKPIVLPPVEPQRLVRPLGLLASTC